MTPRERRMYLYTQHLVGERARLQAIVRRLQDEGIALRAHIARLEVMQMPEEMEPEP